MDYKYRSIMTIVFKIRNLLVLIKTMSLGGNTYKIEFKIEKICGVTVIRERSVLRTYVGIYVSIVDNDHIYTVSLIGFNNICSYETDQS